LLNGIGWKRCERVQFLWICVFFFGKFQLFTF
jgi:hypothetical protein